MSNDPKTPTHSVTTRTVRAALDTDTQFGAVVPPIHLTSTFSFAGFGEKRAYDYSRSGNPTRDALAGALADLEGGAGAVVTGSGMAAVGLVTQLFRPGQVAVVPHDCYGGTYRLFNALRERGSLDVRFVDFQQPQALADALASRPAMVWIETPSNPLLRIVDI
jgi:cystathionine gamma-synthase